MAVATSPSGSFVVAERPTARQAAEPSVAIEHSYKNRDTNGRNLHMIRSPLASISGGFLAESALPSRQSGNAAPSARAANAEKKQLNVYTGHTYRGNYDTKFHRPHRGQGSIQSLR